MAVSAPGVSFTLENVITLNSNFPTLFPGTTNFADSVALTEVVPLPPAIALFGSALGGAFWLGRRKRSAVSGLGSA
jgi:hypothetical protein